MLRPDGTVIALPEVGLHSSLKPTELGRVEMPHLTDLDDPASTCAGASSTTCTLASNSGTTAPVREGRRQSISASHVARPTRARIASASSTSTWPGGSPAASRALARPAHSSSSGHARPSAAHA